LVPYKFIKYGRVIKFSQKKKKKKKKDEKVDKPVVR
jgi:hypothetical protein